MADIHNSATLALAPVQCQQKPAAPFAEPVDLNWSPAISGPLDQAFVAKTKKIGMELVATEGQAASNLSRVMPASIAKGLEHQALQFATLSHKAILSASVSILLFATGTTQEASRVRETAKACTLRNGFVSKFFSELFPYLVWKWFVSNAQQI